jgi:hypothetical protein
MHSLHATLMSQFRFSSNLRVSGRLFIFPLQLGLWSCGSSIKLSAVDRMLCLWSPAGFWVSVVTATLPRSRSRRPSEIMSLNCGHQRAFVNPLRWCMSMESHGGMMLTEEAEELGEGPFPMPLCSPLIERGLTRLRTRASAVTDRRLTTWAIVRPLPRSLLRLAASDPLRTGEVLFVRLRTVGT